jgi:arsenite/tail-anchored protein-transporting ATPase
MTPLIEAFESLGSRRVLLFGGKGGVGKTTVAAAAALHFASKRATILFTTDPASNLTDLFGEGLKERPETLQIESLEATALYARFLKGHLDSFLEIGDRGTYLDREELRRLFALSLPGIDELMGWMRIGELAEGNPEAILIVDTAPTGHTLRMLSSSAHFRQLAVALDAMQEKHRTMVLQFTRRASRDAFDQFIDDFELRARRRSEMLTDPARAAFIPVALSEPLVIDQTLRLISEVGPMDVPFVVLNRAVVMPDCERDRRRKLLDEQARAAFAPRDVVAARRSCVPLDTAGRIATWSRTTEATAVEGGVSGAGGSRERSGSKRSIGSGKLRLAPLLFLAGKGGVGKTSCATSIALQLARQNPQKRYAIVSVDPAHSLRDVFRGQSPPSNLAVETIDTRAKWEEFRESTGQRISDAFDSLTPRGMTVAHDREAMQQIIEIAPPGADELFAIVRLSDLAEDRSLDGIIVDTAPTGHFLRLLELPRAAREWVQEFMRILLRYRELIASGSLGEDLVRASKALKILDETLCSERSAVVVVTRPERIVVAESKRLVDELRSRGIPIGGVIGNYLTPANDCPCDAAMRAHELAALEELEVDLTVERRDEAPATLDDLAALVPLG